MFKMFIQIWYHGNLPGEEIVRDSLYKKKEMKTNIFLL